MKKSLIIVFGLLVLSLSQVANANTITYDFTLDNCTGGCIGSNGIGTVTLTEVGSDVLVTVDIDPNYYVSTGSGDGFYVKFELDSGFTASNITGLAPALKAVYDSSNTLDGDGTGYYNFGITCAACTTGNDPYYSDITFTVTGATIDSFNVNNLGILFTADVYSIQTGRTGPVGVVPSNVPDGGSTVTLLGSVLLGMGMLRRKFSKS